MPKTRQSHRPAPSCPPERDFELCKVIFGAALSQILYARHGFAPSLFQSVSICDLISTPFDDLLSSGSPLSHYDQEIIRDQGSTVFLRADLKDYDLSSFLGILTSDIFSLIEKEELVKFRINFLRSENLKDDNLLEYYTVVLKYDLEGNYGMDIWRAGTIECYTSNSEFKLWNLGDYLSRLPSLTGPVYCTLAFHSTNRPTENLIGTWKFDHSDFDNAKLRLQQRPEYCFQRIARLNVGPAVDCSLPTVSSPETDDAELRDTELGDADIGDEQPEDAIADKPPEAATSDRSTDVDYEVPSESDSPAYKPPPKKRQTAAKEKEKKSAKPVNKPKRAAAKMASQPHPLSPPITGISRANTSSARSKKNSGKESTKPKAKGHQEQSLKKNKMDAPKPKRKAKQPLLIFSDPASNLPETQDAIRESQIKHQSTNTGKRQRDQSANTAAYSNKKQRQFVPEPSSGQFRLIDGVVLTSSPIRTSNLSSVGDTPPVSDQTMGGGKGNNRSKPKSKSTRGKIDTRVPASIQATEAMPRKESLLGNDFADTLSFSDSSD